MERRDAEELINSLYKKLFYLPRTTLLGIAYTLEGLAISWANAGALKGSLLIAIPALAGLLAYLALIHITFSLGGAVDSFKKSLGIAVISLAPYIVVDFIASYRERYFLSFPSSSGMIFLTHYIFKGKMLSSFSIAVVSSVAPAILSLAAYRALSHTQGSLMISSIGVLPLVTSLISIASIMVFIAVLELGGRASGMKTFEIARGFLRAWLFSEAETLENALHENSVKGDLRVRVVSIYREGSSPIHLIYPGLHYGPFRRVGSSDAVYIFDKHIEGLGHRSIVFHTIGSHEKNIVRRSFVERVARELSGKIAVDPRGGGALRGPVRLSKSGWRGLAFGGDGCVALHISSEKGSDDLPESIEKILYGIERARGVMIAVADSHSNYGRDEADEEAIAEIAVSSVEAIEREPGYGEAMVGYGEAQVDRLCRGMCAGRVKALVLRSSGKDYAIVYLYGNNVHHSARREIIDIASRMGFKDVEVITPDDHSCAAESLGTAYTAIHMCQALPKAIVSALKTAVEDLKLARIYCREYTWEGAPYMGRIVWNYLKALEILGPLTSKLWAITLVLSIAVLSILALLLPL